MDLKNSKSPQIIIELLASKQITQEEAESRLLQSHHSRTSKLLHGLKQAIKQEFIAIVEAPNGGCSWRSKLKAIIISIFISLGLLAGFALILFSILKCLEIQ